MSNNEKQYEIIIWETNPDGNGRHVVKVPVEKEVFDNYYRPINAHRRTAQNHGRCVCPKSKRLLCNMDCGRCSYATEGDLSSLNDTFTNDEGEEMEFIDTLPSDEPGIEEEMMKVELLAELGRLLNALSPEDRMICEMVKEGKTEREMASVLDRSQQWVNYHKTQLFKSLKQSLEKFL